MECLSYDVRNKFLKGEHLMRPQAVSDMFIKTTFMCNGHGPDVIAGITLK